MPIKSVWWGLVLLAGMALPGLAQGPVRYNFFGGALLGTPNGFTAGAGLTFALHHNISFDPTVAVGRSGHAGLFTLDGSFRYEFHPDDEAIIPYLLVGVGLAQWGSATHGSGIVGVGARFPIGHNTWIVPEVRGATHGLARFTIGISKSF
ncbi:MAG: hypothetical protein ACRD1E_10455 [Terriglobales bacterium]